MSRAHLRGLQRFVFPISPRHDLLFTLSQGPLKPERLMPGSGGRLPLVSRFALEAAMMAAWPFVTEYKLHISTPRQPRMPTARDATIAMVVKEIDASTIIRSFARAVSGKVSAGEKAVAFVNARNR
jgi:hypothetical protein